MRGFLAAAGDEVARPNVSHAGADALHSPGCAIAERRESLEAVANGVDRCPEAVGTDLLEHLANLIGTASRLADQTRPSKVDFRPLGACTHERSVGSNQHLPVVQLRRRDVNRSELAVLHPLGELLHAVPLPAGTGTRSSPPSIRSPRTLIILSPKARCV